MPLPVLKIQSEGFSCFRHGPLHLLPSADRRCRLCTHADYVPSKPPSRTPRPGLVKHLMAGLLTCGSSLGCPSRPALASGYSASLAAYSCGGSHGFGACWLHLTVFPFHPVFAVRGNHLWYKCLRGNHLSTPDLPAARETDSARPGQTRRFFPRKQDWISSCTPHVCAVCRVPKAFPLQGLSFARFQPGDRVRRRQALTFCPAPDPCAGLG